MTRASKVTKDLKVMLELREILVQMENREIKENKEILVQMVLKELRENKEI